MTGLQGPQVAAHGRFQPLWAALAAIALSCGKSEPGGTPATHTVDSPQKPTIPKASADLWADVARQGREVLSLIQKRKTAELFRMLDVGVADKYASLYGADESFRRDANETEQAWHARVQQMLRERDPKGFSSVTDWASYSSASAEERFGLLSGLHRLRGALAQLRGEPVWTITKCSVGGEDPRAEPDRLILKYALRSDRLSVWPGETILRFSKSSGAWKLMQFSSSVGETPGIDGAAGKRSQPDAALANTAAGDAAFFTEIESRARRVLTMLRAGQHLEVSKELQVKTRKTIDLEDLNQMRAADSESQRSEEDWRTAGFETRGRRLDAVFVNHAWLRKHWSPGQPIKDNRGVKLVVLVRFDWTDGVWALEDVEIE